MAEGLLRHLEGIAAMKEVGINISRHRSKALDEFLGQRSDYVITVCDRAKQQCPVIPGATPIHWGFDDPAEALEEQQAQTFRRVRDEIS